MEAKSWEERDCCSAEPEISRESLAPLFRTEACQAFPAVSSGRIVKAGPTSFHSWRKFSWFGLFRNEAGDGYRAGTRFLCVSEKLRLRETGASGFSIGSPLTTFACAHITMPTTGATICTMLQNPMNKN
jgi:hypothetical protein